MNLLETLFQELGFKTPPEEISAHDQKQLIPFLKKEQEYRTQAKIERLLRQSGLKPVKTLAQFDWSFNTNIPKQDILAFAHSPWIQQPANLILIGDSGIGKSHLARALCYEAILQGIDTLFITTFDLLSKIKRSIYPQNKIDYVAKRTVLCLDELGYTYHKKEDTDLIFQIISKRCELRPTIITTNLVPKEWGAIFSGPAASAILDRLSFNGTFLTLEGRSYRLKNRKK